MITSLTDAQKARFPEFTDKWVKIGLCTEPADRPRAEKAIRGMYKLANLDEPKIVWLPCPMSGVLAAMEFARRMAMHRVDDQVYDQVDAQVRAQVRAQVYDQVYDQVDAQVRAQVRAQVDAQVYAQVHAQVRAQVRAQVYAQVDAQVDAQARSAGGSYFGASLWAAYPSWADYFNKVCGVKIDRNYLELTESCGYAWLLRGVCFATERPDVINLDSQGRLHCEDGMSIRYPSGWGLHHWHGKKIEPMDGDVRACVMGEVLAGAALVLD